MNDELKTLIAHKMDVLQFLDFINMSFEELLDSVDFEEYEEALWNALG